MKVKEWPWKYTSVGSEMTMGTRCSDGVCFMRLTTYMTTVSIRHPVRTIALMHIEVAPKGRERGRGLTNLEVDSIARFKAGENRTIARARAADIIDAPSSHSDGRYPAPSLSMLIGATT